MIRGNRGQVLILVAFAILFLMGVAALAIDVGFMYSTRHELQRSADSGALAGASAFVGGVWDNGNLSSPTMVEADARARDYASRDAVSPPIGATSPVHLDSATEVDVAFPLMNHIRVTTRRQVNLFFARVLGYPMREITAFATARLQVINSRLTCLKPWGIPFPWEDTDGDRQYDADEVVNDNNDKCPKDGSPPPPNVFCQGSPIILKVGTPQGKPEDGQPDIPNIQQESGHFFALDFGSLIGAGSGAHTYKELIKEDCPDNTLELSTGDSVPLKPGDMVGPTIQAVAMPKEGDNDSLMNQDPDSQWIDGPGGGLPSSPKYPIDNGAWMNSPRVVRIPIYDPSVALAQGKTDMTIAGFAGFWIQEAYEQPKGQGTVIGRYIPMSAFGHQAGPDPGPLTGPVIYNLQLVE